MLLPKLGRTYFYLFEAGKNGYSDSKRFAKRFAPLAFSRTALRAI